jgi:hypothetical protein
MIDRWIPQRRKTLLTLARDLYRQVPFQNALPLRQSSRGLPRVARKATSICSESYFVVDDDCEQRKKRCDGHGGWSIALRNGVEVRVDGVGCHRLPSWSKYRLTLAQLRCNWFDQQIRYTPTLVVMETNADGFRKAQCKYQ